MDIVNVDGMPCPGKQKVSIASDAVRPFYAEDPKEQINMPSLLSPIVGSAIGPSNNGDAVIFFNFRVTCPSKYRGFHRKLHEFAKTSSGYILAG